MKKLQVLAVAVLLAVSVSIFTSGCASTPSGGGGGTNTTTVITPQTLQDASIILKSAARDASALAIDSNQDNKKYVTLAVATMDTFLVGNDYTPGALAKALAGVIKQVQDVRVNLAINAVTDLYEIFYGRYVKNQIASNPTAILFITALRDGASQGLDATSAAKIAK